MWPSSGQEEFYKIPNNSGWTIWPVTHTGTQLDRSFLHGVSVLSPWEENKQEQEDNREGQSKWEQQSNWGQVWGHGKMWNDEFKDNMSVVCKRILEAIFMLIIIYYGATLEKKLFKEFYLAN